MSLFQLGDFQLHSGLSSHFKIDCDALTDEDLATIAYLLVDLLPTSFGSVIGIPTGGTRLAEKMVPYVTEGPLLIVDDVLTTGGSMEEERQKHQSSDTIGAVIFSRAEVFPDWITALFLM